MPRRCNIEMCTAPGVRIHAFLSLKSKPERFKTWVQAIGGKLDTPEDYEYSNQGLVIDIFVINIINDIIEYKRYVNFERRSNPRYESDIHVVMTVNSAFTIDSSVDVIPPTVSKTSKEKYHNYVQRKNGCLSVSPASVAIYKKYVNFNL